ncbi:GNAT family N-acetyltransferase [Enterobacter hormaechei]|uniref:GNAT family N-acetyltransferase n=1 Tax=Enterobacter hormaechei TaxID=158836 RepID=UPI0039C6AA5C
MTVAKPMWRDEKWPVLEITTATEFTKHNVRDFLEQISCFYPNFHAWLNFTFVSQLKSGQRKALIIKEGQQIAGVSLIKISAEEQKISTFFVAPTFQRKGYGDALMERSLSYLHSPVNITVCDERWNEMHGFLAKHNFKCENFVKDFYRPGFTEYFCSLR